MYYRLCGSSNDIDHNEIFFQYIEMCGTTILNFVTLWPYCMCGSVDHKWNALIIWHFLLFVSDGIYLGLCTSCIKFHINGLIIMRYWHDAISSISYISLPHSNTFILMCLDIYIIYAYIHTNNPTTAVSITYGRI